MAKGDVSNKHDFVNNPLVSPDSGCYAWENPGIQPSTNVKEDAGERASNDLGPFMPKTGLPGGKYGSGYVK